MTEGDSGNSVPEKPYSQGGEKGEMMGECGGKTLQCSRKQFCINQAVRGAQKWLSRGDYKAES